MRAVGILFVTSFLFILTLQCSNNQKNVSAKNKLSAYAGTEPLTYLVERIGGGRVDVKTLMPPGQDPHHFKPTPQHDSALQTVKLLFKTGFLFENHHFTKAWVFNESLTVVNTAKGLQPRKHYCYNPNHNHLTYGGPYIWLGYSQIERIVKIITEALVKIDPKHTKYYFDNLEIFLRELDDIDSTIARSLAPFKGRKFIAINPTAGYFADSYGLVETVIDHKPSRRQVPFKEKLYIPDIPKSNKNPAPDNLTKIIEMAKEDSVRMIVIQPGFDTTMAAAIAEAVDGKIVTLNPLVKNVLQNLEDIAVQIERALHNR